MIFTETSLKDSFVIDLKPHGDNRGWFMRTYCKNEFTKIGLNAEWVQMNHSFSSERGTLRGMHFQKPPFSEIKMVRCISGSVFDVIIDLRTSSKTYLQWFGVELSASNKKMIYIPEGFAHGFQTLEPDTELVYNHSQYYNAEFEGGIPFDDPAVNISWPLEISELSARDKTHAAISTLNENYF